MNQRPSTKLPKYCLHKDSGCARVWINARNKHESLGKYGSPESRRKYDRLMRKYFPSEAKPEKSVATELLEQIEQGGSELTVGELCICYMDWAKTNYQKNDAPTGELGNAQRTIRDLRSQYGDLPASKFGPVRFKAFRANLEDRRLTAETIKKYMRHVVGVYRHASEHELIEVDLFLRLKNIRPIKLAASKARKSKKTPLPNIDFYEASLGDLRPILRDMVLVMEKTGMRTSELAQMKPREIDRSDPEMWAYRPNSHKTDHHGDDPKIILLGPVTQKILQKYLFSKSYCFLNQKGNCFDSKGFTKSVQRSQVITYKKLMGIENLKADINTLSDDQKADFINNYRWYPRQVRRLRAQRAFDHSGLEATSQLLGHSSMKTTERYYVEPNNAEARAHVRKFG